jgi:multicomponent Na+:H+ antiporter subunit G
VTAATAWLADGLVLLGLAITTLAVLGLVRLPDVYLRLHAASKAVVLGVVPLLLAVVVVGDASMRARAVLVGAFLLLTTPVSTHAIARAATLRRARLQAPPPGAAAPGPAPASGGVPARTG